MKHTLISKKMLIPTLTLLLLGGACKKDDLTDSQEAILSDNAAAEQSWEDVSAVADESKAKQEGTNSSQESFSRIGNCATVTIDSSVTPSTITVDFGPTNCLGKDGKYRRGVLNITYTGRYRTPGTIITINPSNYYVNDKKVEGTRTITNLGRNAANNLHFNVTVVNGKITRPTGEVTTWNTNHEREWTAGEATPDKSDDVYSITGSRSGVNFKGVSYTATITNPLIAALNCAWIKQGTIEFTSADFARKATLDFGNGSCDNQATVTVRNRTKNITLK